MPSSHLPRILITGGSGQVGHCLKAQLEGCAELSVPDSSALNIADRRSVRQAVETFRPDYIINAAAYTAVDKAESDAGRAFAVNRDGARHLAEAAEAAGAAMLHISTDYVFDGVGARLMTKLPQPRRKTYTAQASWRESRRYWPPAAVPW